MKKVLLILFLFYFGITSAQEIKKGKVISQTFLAPSVQGNPGGEEPLRRVSIYLPPGYDESNQRYPTLYFLHGFFVNDSLMIWLGFPDLLNTAIQSGRMPPAILVAPNSDTRFKGSFYTNSSLTGKWADYIGKDVVGYIDKNFRTIVDKNARGLCGLSMGGYGALKVAMLHPDVFGAVYALSPFALNWSNEISVNNPAFKEIGGAKSESEIWEAASKNLNVLSMMSLARTYSPNEKQSIYQGSLPVSYKGDSMIVNVHVVKQWEAHFPYNMIDTHLAALKSLNALKIDWGRNDELKNVPAASLQFSKKLEAYGVKHFAEEYIGGHSDKIAGFGGRIYTEVLPFFGTYLKFEDKNNLPPMNKGRKKVKN